MVSEALGNARVTASAMAKLHSKYAPPESQAEGDEDVARQTLRAWWTTMAELLLAVDAPDFDPQVVYDQVSDCHARAQTQLREITRGRSLEAFLKDPDPAVNARVRVPDRHAHRAEVLQKLRDFVSTLQGPGPLDAVQLLKRHCVNVYGVRTVFMEGVIEKVAREEKAEEGSLGDTVARWDLEGTAMLETCVEELRPPTSAEVQTLLDPYQKLVAALDGLLELLVLIGTNMDKRAEELREQAHASEHASEARASESK
jgi:hypothetical protein